MGERVSGMDVLRERIARALWKHRYPGYWREGALWDLARSDADAVVAALGLRQIRNVVDFDEPRRRYVTLWERIEEGK